MQKFNRPAAYLAHALVASNSGNHSEAFELFLLGMNQYDKELSAVTDADISETLAEIATVAFPAAPPASTVDRLRELI